MTDRASQTDAGAPLNPTLDGALRAATRFADLGYLAPDGLLDLATDIGPVSTVRIEVPAGQSLQLQSIGIDAEDVGDIASVAQVRASSRQNGEAQGFDPARLFDVARPSGTLIQTRPDGPGWVEVRFAHRLQLRRIRLRNVSAETARQARGIRVTARTGWRTRRLYDGGAQLRAWRAVLADAKAVAVADPETTALLEVLDLTVRGHYGRAHSALASRVADEQARRRFRAALDEGLLAARGMEWTVHGPQRPFRRWTEDERVDYVRESASVTEALRSLTPNVCLGFGSVLAVVRDHALIPHDDDLDIIVGFEVVEASTLSDGLRLVEEHLRPLGYDVSGQFAAHRHVQRPGRKHVDVFVGVFEGESIAWYPGPRHGLTRDVVFPPAPASLLGVPCSIPAQPEVYLERLYGEGWRIPDPYFSHAWDLSAYADITGRPVAPSTTGAQPTQPGSEADSTVAGAAAASLRGPGVDGRA